MLILELYLTYMCIFYEASAFPRQFLMVLMTALNAMAAVCYMYKSGVPTTSLSKGHLSFMILNAFWLVFDFRDGSVMLIKSVFALLWANTMRFEIITTLHTVRDNYEFGCDNVPDCDDVADEILTIELAKESEGYLEDFW
ncbi:hypothetical protein PENTCL1PPCAC_23979, partial [Pristionchus entomophagus]